MPQQQQYGQQFNHPHSTYNNTNSMNNYPYSYPAPNSSISNGNTVYSNYDVNYQRATYNQLGQESVPQHLSPQQMVQVVYPQSASNYQQYYYPQVQQQLQQVPSAQSVQGVHSVQQVVQPVQSVQQQYVVS